jgi:hypothetical protein
MVRARCEKMVCSMGFFLNDMQPFPEILPSNF